MPSRLGDVTGLVRRSPAGAGLAPDTGGWLWLLHGNSSSADDVRPLIERLAEAMDAGALPQAGIAAADGPWSGGAHWWVDSAFTGSADVPPGRAVESTLLRDVLPAVEDGPTRERGLVGISMGGASAARWALCHPGTFAYAALLSPAMYDGPAPPSSSARTGGAFGAGDRLHDEATYRRLMSPQHLLAARDARGPTTRLSITVGDAEPVLETADGSPLDLAVTAAQLHTRLRWAGVRSSLRVVAGGHDPAVWEREVVGAVRRARDIRPR